MKFIILTLLFSFSFSAFCEKGLLKGWKSFTQEDQKKIRKRYKEIDELPQERRSKVKRRLEYLDSAPEEKRTRILKRLKRMRKKRRRQYRN